MTSMSPAAPQGWVGIHAAMSSCFVGAIVARWNFAMAAHPRACGQLARRSDLDRAAELACVGATVEAMNVDRDDVRGLGEDPLPFDARGEHEVCGTLVV